MFKAAADAPLWVYLDLIVITLKKSATNQKFTADNWLQQFMTLNLVEQAWPPASRQIWSHLIYLAASPQSTAEEN